MCGETHMCWETHMCGEAHMYEETHMCGETHICVGGHICVERHICVGRHICVEVGPQLGCLYEAFMKHFLNKTFLEQSGFRVSVLSCYFAPS